jgi:hypothetical protein
MIPLTLRPTGLRNSAAFAHLADWSVIEDGEVIGRIYEQHASARNEMAWFWSITALIPNPTGTTTSGHAATFEEAKAQFQDHWFNAWKRARHDPR